MVFSSTVFLFLFLPTVITLYFLLPFQLKNTFLLLASLFFYAWGESFFVLIMLASIAANYIIGILLHRLQGSGSCKWVLGVGITINLAFLAAFKYANFLVDNINLLLTTINAHTIELAQVHLPIGISFFTFQAISYIIDISRGEAKVQKNPLNVALYISMFPQLIAGPIVRYHDISKQIITRHVAVEDFAYGCRRFILGLGKKMLLANPLGLVADQIFALSAGELSTSLAWLGILCYTLQIYFDFSAYSDMAIGLGRIFGFRFLENFNYPYISQSIQEFWRRWHISLSTWFRDYLYISLGGNRVAQWRVYFNLALVFVLCGLWHGASWNFVIWGIIHGSFLIFERMGLLALLASVWRPLRHMYVLLVVMLAWVFFRLETLPEAMEYLRTMFGLNQPLLTNHTISMYLHADKAILLAIGILVSIPILPVLDKRLQVYLSHRYNKAVLYRLETMMVLLGLAGVLLLSSMYLASGTHNPFIYFRF